MTLAEFQEVVEDLYHRNDLSDPGIFIRIGDQQAPLSSIKVVKEDENYYESVILQDTDYPQLLM